MSVSGVAVHREARLDSRRPDPSRAFALGLALDVAFVVVEIGAGVVAGSVALLSDAVHNLGDALGLFLGWIAVRLARRARTRRRTYGFRRATILAALANALLIIGGVGVVAFESIRRLHEGGVAHAGTMLVVAGAGVGVNAGAALLFAKGRRHDANVRGAFLHLVADAGVSAAVVAGGALLYFTGWAWIDPVLGLAVCAVIVASAWPLLRESVDLALDAVPSGVDAAAIGAFLSDIDGVREVHDLHVWPLSTTETALTAHLASNRDLDSAELRVIADRLERDFGVHHTTIQVERPAGADAASTSLEGRARRESTA
jgi:cobalt-zinc-cadmium efflux system protein